MAEVKITEVSGYVCTPVRKACGTCKYLVQGTLCRNKVVATDPEVPGDRESHLKRVSAENGCCNEWEPGAAPDAEGEDDAGAGRGGRHHLAGLLAGLAKMAPDAEEGEA